jgi:hypothetical protein
LTGCLRNLNAPSRWPPEDFRLEVRAYDLKDGVPVPSQSMRVFSEGLVLFRKASGAIGSRSGVPPLAVFDTVCVYQLQTPSLRSLSRAIDRSGVLRLEPVNASDSTVSSAATGLVIRYRLFGNEGEISTDTTTPGALDRVVRLLNGYAPESTPFRYSGLGSPIDTRSLEEVPEPRKSPLDSLAIHAEFASRHPDDTGLWLDLFALAVSTGNRDQAKNALEHLRASGAAVELGWFPDEFPADPLLPLEELIPQADSSSAQDADPGAEADAGGERSGGTAGDG